MGKEMECSGDEEKIVPLEHDFLRRTPWFKIHTDVFLSSKAKAWALA